jgi:hypothetical protein
LLNEAIFQLYHGENKLYFDEHLRTNPDSEIIGELNRINAVLQDFITDN